jgi:hypothetical protein
MSGHGRIARARATVRIAIATAAAALAALAGPAPVQAQTQPDPYGVAPTHGSLPVTARTLAGERVRLGLVFARPRHFYIGAVGSRNWGFVCCPDVGDPLYEPYTHDPRSYQLGGGGVPGPQQVSGPNCNSEIPFPVPSYAAMDHVGVNVGAACFVVGWNMDLSAAGGLWGYIAPPRAEAEGGGPVIFHDWTVTDGLVDGYCGAGNVGYRATEPLTEFGAIENPFAAYFFTRGIGVLSYIDVERDPAPYGKGWPASYEVLYAPASPDVTKPIVTVMAPQDCAHLDFGQAVTVDYECDDLGSGVATCTGTQPDGAALDTSRLGERQFTVTGTDNQGHARTRTVRYFVEGTYGFTGFAAPIDNGFTNTAKAGQAIPVKYRLTTPAGAPVSDPASFVGLTSQSGGGSCAGLPADAIETYTGSSGLQYLGDGNWQFNWKTPKNYAGQCRTMTLTLNDDSTHTAAFSFK